MIYSTSHSLVKYTFATRIWKVKAQSQETESPHPALSALDSPRKRQRDTKWIVSVLSFLYKEWQRTGLSTDEHSHERILNMPGRRRKRSYILKPNTEAFPKVKINPFTQKQCQQSNPLVWMRDLNA